MLTFETFPRFERDWKNLTSQQQAMFRKIVLEAFVPDLMARTARSSEACASKGSSNITNTTGTAPVTCAPDSGRYPSARLSPTSRCRRPCGSSRCEWSLNAAGCSNVAKVVDDLAE